MSKKLMLLIIGFFMSNAVAAQNSDTQYRMSLKQVLDLIERRYNVTIKYNTNQVAEHSIDYAQWRLRDDVEAALQNVLAPADLIAKKEREGVYKLANYQYHLWDIKDGWDHLDRVSSNYNDRSSWEKRRAKLRKEIKEALRLDPMPPAPDSKPIKTAKRIMNGYTVENIAIEFLPGVYVNGSLYKPDRITGKVPLVLSPDGHWEGHRYRADCQLRAATIARMGAMAFTYDLFAWGESLLQFDLEDHRRSLSHTMQILAGIRILDYLLTLEEIDHSRVGISGGSGGGSHSVMLAAIDDRIKLSAPVVSLSSYHFGGCPCESGMPIHFAAGGTSNPEIAAVAAPIPQLIVSDGGDWTRHAPEKDIPYLKRVYGYYGKAELVENVHLPDEGHDFGISKRKALYNFLIKHFQLDKNQMVMREGVPDESAVTIEPKEKLYVFGEKGESLPVNAIKGFTALEELFDSLRDSHK